MRSGESHLRYTCELSFLLCEFSYGAPKGRVKRAYPGGRRCVTLGQSQRRIQEECDIIIQARFLAYISVLSVNKSSFSLNSHCCLHAYLILSPIMPGNSQNRRFFSRLRKIWIKNIRPMCCFSAGEKRNEK